MRNTGNLDTDHLYTGQVLDESSGLAFYNARYYDPAIGRFVTPDSIVPNPNDGQDYHRYTYVRNNPIKYNDPSGNLPAALEYGNESQQSQWKVREADQRMQKRIWRASSPVIYHPEPASHAQPQESAPLLGTFEEDYFSYSLTYDLEVHTSAGAVFDELVTNFNGGLFPFGSDCAELVRGADCDLTTGFLSDPVRVLHVGEDSFSFVSSEGHFEGVGNRITFHFVDGGVQMTVTGRGPYDNFVNSFDLSRAVNQHVVIPLIWSSFADNLEASFG